VAPQGALSVALDALAGLCALFNAAYFLGYLAGRGRGPSYRLAAGALALVSLAVAAESGVLLAWRGSQGAALAGAWGLARLLTALGALAISLLVLRRIVTLQR
jgi:hypothetical protein